MLLWVLQELLPESQQAIVFACTRHHVEFVHNVLKAAGVSSAPIYGQLDQTARAINLAKFRGRKCRTLVVTDVAARGIDIPYLDNVINFDFPDKPKLFVHRYVRSHIGYEGNSCCAHADMCTRSVSTLYHLYRFAVWGALLVRADAGLRSRL